MCSAGISKEAAMPWHTRIAEDGGEDPYLYRVMRAFDRRRVGIVALVTVLLSAGSLSSPDLLAFFSPAEIALLWLEHLAEVSVLAAALMIAYTLLDESMQGQPR